ncbi:MAG TPA: FAD-dependent oxidoreductase [Gaiellaceae bacterium]|nr:FAD-dependent oxidoreductase [Gaiellaceae bacterium]
MQPPLQGTRRADVCIMGGGYTGLWTAYFLKERVPTLDVVVVEGDICGGGASGRNGGFALTWWAKLSSLVKVCGEDDAVWLATESERAVDFLGDFVAQNKIDADYIKAGWLWTATSQAQIGRWDGALADLERRGIDAYTVLPREELCRRGGSERYLAGLIDRTQATVQPARLVRGLRDVVLERGVQIYENSPVVSIDEKGVVTASGRVDADKVVCALGVWTLAFPEFRELRRACVPIASDMIATAPMSETLAEIGWTGGESITDSRQILHYLRTTSDGRIAIGRGGGAVGKAGRFDWDFHYDPARSRSIADDLRWLYPETQRVPITHAWSGPSDRSHSGMPLFGHLRRRKNVLYAVGFSGSGVGPCILGGKILASLALDADDRWAKNALADGSRHLFPPEPIRYLGGRLVKRAVEQKEAVEDQGRTAGFLTRALARQAPGGVIKVADR